MAGSPSPPVVGPSHSAEDRLESWKEIATYLKRGVRTVRRWEKEEGLPVRRHLHQKLGTVYAYKSEIDAWWEGRRHHLETQSEELDSAAKATARLSRRWVALGGIVALTLAAAGYFSWRGPPRVAVPAGKIMLAVLPFESLGSEAGQAYWVDGFTEDLITELGRLQPQRLGVIARTSVMPYRGTQKTVRQIASELSVQYILEGSVRREGNQLRITAQLIQADDQTHVWAERFDRPPDDLLRVQAEIASAIAREIALELPVGHGRTARVRPEVQDALFRGRYLLEQRTEPAIRGAIQQFERALQLEPRYAVAHVGLAEAYALLPVYADVPAAEGMPRARQAALRARELDETLPGPHAILGLVLAEYDWDWGSAEREYRRAIELNPNYANARKLYAEYLSYMGRFDEAITEARTARELDPVSPVANAVLGAMLYTARRYDDAIAQLRRATEIHPNHPLAYMLLGLAYGQKQLHTEAIGALEKGLELSGNNTEYLAQLAGVCARAGRRRQARDLLRELERRSRTQYVSPFLYAVVHTSLGEPHRALDWLERGYKERLWLMCVLKTEPVFDALRNDPRFQDLLRRMNFPSN